LAVMHFKKDMTMKKTLFLICFSLTICSTILGQDDKRYIIVRGSAESEVTPDIIIISIRLREYEENKQKVTLDKIESDFTSAVTKSKINKDRIVLSDISINSVQQRRRDRDFYAQKTYNINFSKTEDVLTFLENLKSVKIDYLDIAKLSHTEIEKYRLEIKIEALKAAEKKADALLNSVGAKRGKPLLIDESPSEVTDWRPRNMDSNALYKIVDNETLGISEIPLKKIKLRFEILARFEIE
jgi:uncharacterized protein YggE